MKKYLPIVFFIVALGFVIAGCGKTEAQPDQKITAPTFGPQITGKILYEWKGFDKSKYGTPVGFCIYANGEIQKILPKTSYATWIMKGIVLRSLNQQRRTDLRNLEVYDMENDKIEQSLVAPNSIARAKLLANRKQLLVQVAEQKNKKYTDNLAILDSQTNELKKITKFPVGSDWSIFGFDISQDESKIAYSYGRTNELKRQIKIIDINGSEIEELLFDATSPAWSPDGERLVFTAPYHNDKSGLSDIEITLYDFQTKKATRLTHHEGIASTPDFSPDGKQIVYVLWYAGGRVKNLAVINIDGTGFQTLLPEDHIRQGQVSNPDWGP